MALPRNWFHMIAVSIALLSLSSCGQQDAASFLAAAKADIEKSDYKSAVIQLRNALQKTPEDIEARFLFATALLETGDAPGAETEIRKLADRGYPPDKTTPLL